MADDEVPGARAARGERFTNVPLDWETPRGRRSAARRRRHRGGARRARPWRSSRSRTSRRSRRARRRADTLAEVGAALEGSLDPRAMAMVVARLAVPRLADWCAVELADARRRARPRRGGRRAGAGGAGPHPAAGRRGRGRRAARRAPRPGGARRRSATSPTAARSRSRTPACTSSCSVARDELEAIFAGVADAVTVQGADGRLRHVNDAAVRLLGEPIGLDRDGLLAADPVDLRDAFELLDEDGPAVPLRPAAGPDRAHRRRAASPLIARYRRKGTSEERWVRIKARPLRAPDGAVTHAINVVEDITDLKQAEETQRLLAEAGRVLASSLDYEATLRSVAWLARARAGRLVHGRPAHGARPRARRGRARRSRRWRHLAEGLQGIAHRPRGHRGPGRGRAQRALRAPQRGRPGAHRRRRAQPAPPRAARAAGRALRAERADDAARARASACSRSP